MMDSLEMKLKCFASIFLTLLVSTSALNLSSDNQSYLRPNSGAVADIIKVSLELNSIRQIHENDMEFTIDFTIQKYWTDPRLAGTVRKDTLFIHKVPDVWAPDLYIFNSINSKHPDDYSRAFRLKPEGDVMLSERMVSQISCSMGFAKFPFDTQVCDLHLRSHGYTTIHLDMVWHGIISRPVPVFHNEYSFVSAEQSSRTERLATGEFRSLTLTITIRRSGIRYLRRVILPTALIAFISYLTLFLQLYKRKSESIVENETEATTPTTKTEEPESRLSSFQVGLIRLLVNGLMVLIFVFLGQINLLNSPSTATVTGLDLWLAIVGLLVFILFIQSSAVLLEPNRKHKYDTETWIQKFDKHLLYGVPVFFLAFVVIYFGVYLS